jgi:hypothetical protein
VPWPTGWDCGQGWAVSVEAISWALNLAPVPAGRGGHPSSACKFVLVALANHAGPDGVFRSPPLDVSALVRPPPLAAWSEGQMVHSASVGESRAALSAGSRPASAPITRAAARPPAQASVGMAVVQPLTWA